MEKVIDDELRREFAFDQYGRYAIIRDIINQNRKNGEKLKVLDVGGRGNIMKKFLPDDDVYYLDPNLDSDDKNFIKGDGCAMPLGDTSFDWVTSADVFEHIPCEKRNQFLSENIRVAIRGCIIAAPFFSDDVVTAETNANEIYKTIEKKDHEWLIEHIDYALPMEKEIDAFVGKENLKFQKISNNRLFLWLILQETWFNIYNHQNKEKMQDFWNLNYFYNCNVFPKDSNANSYRKTYFIKKDPSLKDLKINDGEIDESVILEIINRALKILTDINLEKNELADNLKHQIHIMQSSKFWKMRNMYLKLKKAILK